MVQPERLIGCPREIDGKLHDSIHPPSSAAGYVTLDPRSPSAFRQPLFWLDLLVKAALLALLAYSVLRTDLPQFQGKGMTTRALTYPLAILIVPLGWLLARRRSHQPSPFPFLADILLVLPFLIDTGGNALDLYDTVIWWDDANHVVNWAILTAAFGQLLLRLPIGRITLVGLAVGFGATTAILWELAEYAAFLHDSPELQTAYTDTLGDLALGLSGSTLAAIAIAALLRAPRPKRSPTNQPREPRRAIGS